MTNLVSVCLAFVLFPLVTNAQLIDLQLVGSIVTVSEDDTWSVPQPGTMAEKAARLSEQTQENTQGLSPQDMAGIASAIETFFFSLQHGNPAEMRQVCAPAAAFKTHMQDQNGNHIIIDETMQDLTAFAVQAGGKMFNIRVEFEMIPPEAGMLDFRAPYRFYVNDSLSHCGVCSFELTRIGTEWKIKQMIDSRSRICE